MQLKQNIQPILFQLATSLSELSNDQYIQKSLLLNGSSIGGHTRHVIELFNCLLNGYNSNTINYEQRKRDFEIETNKQLACKLILNITENIELPNKTLKLVGFYNEETNEECIIETNYYRELIYNLEHSIHHMALIRVAINEVSKIKIPESFGVAPSTMQYKKLCAQ
jgi:hypothetical protein